MLARRHLDVQDEIIHFTEEMAEMRSSLNERPICARPSQPMCHEHHIYAKYHHKKRTAKVHVLETDKCKKSYKTRGVVNVARDFDSHYETDGVWDMIYKNVAVTGLSESKIRELLVSDFSNAEKFREPKRDSMQREFRLSCMSDISDVSGSSIIQNDEIDNEKVNSLDIRQGAYHESCHLMSSIVSSLSDETVSQDHESDKQGESRQGSKLQQASLTFLPDELIPLPNDPDIDHGQNAVLKTSIVHRDFNDGSVPSDDYTVTGLFLDDASYAPHNVKNDKVTKGTYVNGAKKRRICRDRASNNLFLSANYAVLATAIVVEPEDDSIGSGPGSPLGSFLSSSYQIRTKGPHNESKKQHARQNGSNRILKAVAAMFKKAKLTHRSDSDLIVGFNARRSKSEYDCITKGRKSECFACDFSAWERRHQ